MEIIINNDNYENEVVNASVPVLIDFYADWCGPCKMLAPIITEIAEEYAESIKVCKVNVDDNPVLANLYGVTSIPMLAFVKNGETVKTAVGYMPKENIIELFK